MCWENETVVIEFILLGLSNESTTQGILFVIFLFVYVTIIIGNSCIIILTITDKSLHTPMYFFISNLSFVDLCYSSSTIPRILKDIMSVKKTISLTECAAQMYISISLGASECILLAVMAYDRYVAICYPLHYTRKICKTLCIRLAIATWLSGFVLPISNIILSLNVNLCGNNEIDHFLCEMPEILSLGGGNVFTVELIIFIDGVVILLTPVIFIIVTYFHIISSILRIASPIGQKKAFSTCASHIMVVTIFYGSAIAAYMKPSSTSVPKTGKWVAILYFVVAPMLNPLIYTWKNRDVQAAFHKLISKMYSIQI